MISSSQRGRNLQKISIKSIGNLAWGGRAAPAATQLHWPVRCRAEASVRVAALVLSLAIGEDTSTRLHEYRSAIHPQASPSGKSMGGRRWTTHRGAKFVPGGGKSYLCRKSNLPLLFWQGRHAAASCTDAKRGRRCLRWRREGWPKHATSV